MILGVDGACTSGTRGGRSRGGRGDIGSRHCSVQGAHWGLSRGEVVVGIQRRASTWQDGRGRGAVVWTVRLLLTLRIRWLLLLVGVLQLWTPLNGAARTCRSRGGGGICRRTRSRSCQRRRQRRGRDMSLSKRWRDIHVGDRRTGSSGAGRVAIVVVVGYGTLNSRSGSRRIGPTRTRGEVDTITMKYG